MPKTIKINLVERISLKDKIVSFKVRSRPAKKKSFNEKTFIKMAKKASEALPNDIIPQAIPCI